MTASARRSSRQAPRATSKQRSGGETTTSTITAANDETIAVAPAALAFVVHRWRASTTSPEPRCLPYAVRGQIAEPDDVPIGKTRRLAYLALATAERATARVEA